MTAKMPVNEFARGRACLGNSGQFRPTSRERSIFDINWVSTSRLRDLALMLRRGVAPLVDNRHRQRCGQ